MRTYMLTISYVRLYVRFTFIYVRANSRTFMYVRTHVHLCTCIRTYIYVRAYSRTFMYVRTHVHSASHDKTTRGDHYLKTWGTKLKLCFLHISNPYAGGG